MLMAPVRSTAVRAVWPVLMIACMSGPRRLPAQFVSLRGYPPDALLARAPLERAVRETPDPKRIRSYIREMTALPHAAGTPGSKRVAEWALARFKEWGLGAEIDVYQAIIPAPIEQVLELRGPKPWRARLSEEVFDEDPDSKLSGIMPPYAMYGVDGDVTAEVVYANYALPEDFAQLERMGISVTGKIVLSRAGPHSRAVKVTQAAQHGALGLIMYNDPKEDG